MAIRRINVERWSLISARPFAEVVATIEKAIGRPDMQQFGKQIAAAKTWAELERVVQSATGESDLMLFARYDLGQILSKQRSAGAHSMVRLVVGNPLIMKKMTEHVPDAGSYAPVTILVDERADGVHISYDRMSSYLASYDNAAALAVAKDLDAKVEELLRKAAA
ncbi:MAG: DUF302 domain-containing protein [Acidobacteriaceae bacterium]